MNVVILKGTVSRPAHVRTLPSGDTVVGYELTTRVGDDPAEAVPVTWTPGGAKASFVPGDEIVVTGRVRQRFFRANGITQSRTEVVATGIARASDTRRVRKLMGEA